MALTLIAVEVPSGTGDVLAVEAMPTLRLIGFSAAETGGTASTAEVAIRHGGASGNLLVANLNFEADGVALPCWFGPYGLHCPEGIYIDRISGTTAIVLYVSEA